MTKKPLRETGAAFFLENTGMIDAEADLAQQNKAAEILLTSPERVLLIVYKALHDVHGVRMDGIEGRIAKLAPQQAGR